MISIKFHHNPFTDKSVVYFDGILYETSSISKYLNRPFKDWGDKVVDALSVEANDDYTLKYVGFEHYGKILRYYAEKDPNCKMFQIEMPTVDDGVISRLNKLSLLCQNGMEINRYSEQIDIYSDCELALVESILPKPIRLSFYRIRFAVHPMSALSDTNTVMPCFIISSGEPNFTRYKRTIYYLQIADKSEFSGIINGVFWEKCASIELNNLLISYLEMEILPNVIKRVFETTAIDKNVTTFRSFVVLNKTEQTYFVDVPSSIELGERLKLKCAVLPEWCKLDDITIKPHNHNVVSIHDDWVEAIGTGETFIEARHGNEIIGNYPIKSYKRIRAKRITFSHESICLTIGDTMRLEIEYSPQNADNISQIQLSEIEGNIKIQRESAGSILITAEKVGKSKIVGKLGDLDTVTSVSVFPKLERLNIELNRDIFPVGDIAKINVSITPANALVGNFTFDVSPNGIARYDSGVGALIGKSRGNGKLRLTENLTNFSTAIEFVVI